MQQRCSQLYERHVSADGDQADRLRGIDCDPKQATEAAAVLFTLQAGTKAFNANCAGGDKLAAQRSTDALFGFAVKCLSDSGLPSQQTDELRTKISYAEMNRDDKAHRFVVSWNAFQDGNRLAYLALAIAIGIDSLIFMTGLFGANAVRSPLSDVPSSKARNSQQLEAIIENALLPDTLDNARADAQRHAPDHQRIDGFMAEVRPELLEPHTERQRAGRAQRRRRPSARSTTTRRPDRYLVRAELFEFLSIVAKRSFESRQGQRRSRRAGEDRRRGAAARHQPQCRDGAALHAPDRREPRLHGRDQARRGDRGAQAHGAHRRSTPAPRSERVQRAGKNAGYFLHPPRSL